MKATEQIKAESLRDVIYKEIQYLRKFKDKDRALVVLSKAGILGRYLKIDFSDPCSRVSARQIRFSVIEYLVGCKHVVVDLSGVKSMTHGFADELFGILSASLGLNDFLSKVRIVGSDDVTSRTISTAVTIRYANANKEDLR